MPTYTASCDCGWAGDVRMGFDRNTVSCPSCNGVAHKQAVYRISFGGFASTPGHERDYSREFKDFSEAGQEIDHHARQRGEEPPPLFEMAKAKVRDLASKGATKAEDLS